MKYLKVTVKIQRNLVLAPVLTDYRKLTLADQKVLQQLLSLWLPILQPKSQLEPQQICLSYLVEFRDETEQLQQEQTFYSARVRDESMWGGGAGVEVWGLCVSVEVDLTPLSRGTGLRVQWSPAGRRSLSTHADAHSHRYAVHYQYHTCTVTFTEVQTCLSETLTILFIHHIF